MGILLLGLFSAIHCDDDDDEEGALGTEDNPFPADHEGDEEEDDMDAPDSEDEGDPLDSLEHEEDDGGELTQKHMRDLHAKLDHDKNGKVHIEEIMKYAHEARKAIVKKEIQGIFDEIESTQDGHLSLDEHIAEHEEFHEGDDEEKEKQRAHQVAKFKAADLNNDGKLDKEELVHLMHPETHEEVLEVHTKEEMRKRDTDKDGRLSQKEWEVDATHGEYENPESHDPADDFVNLDANKDGFISMDELRHWESGKFHTEKAMKKLYELVDKDGDDHMSLEELAHHDVVEQLTDHDAHPHLMDWVFHDEM